MARKIRTRSFTLRGFLHSHYCLAPIGAGQEAALVKMWMRVQGRRATLNLWTSRPNTNLTNGATFDSSGLPWYCHMVAKAQLDNSKGGWPLLVETNGRFIMVGTVTVADYRAEKVTIKLAPGYEAWRVAPPR